MLILPENSTAELAIPVQITTKEAKAKMEIHSVIAEAKLSQYSI